MSSIASSSVSPKTSVRGEHAHSHAASNCQAAALIPGRSDSFEMKQNPQYLSAAGMTVSPPPGDIDASRHAHQASSAATTSCLCLTGAAAAPFVMALEFLERVGRVTVALVCCPFQACFACTKS